MLANIQQCVHLTSSSRRAIRAKVFYILSCIHAPPRRLERPTYRFVAYCSIRLSYSGKDGSFVTVTDNPSCAGVIRTRVSRLMRPLWYLSTTAQLRNCKYDKGQHNCPNYPKHNFHVDSLRFERRTSGTSHRHSCLIELRVDYCLIHPCTQCEP